MEAFDVISVGDALVDAFLTIKDASSHMTLDQAGGSLCVGYGKKIPVDDCQFLLGGNACNVSVGVARLGLKSALCAEIGDDEFSLKILNGLKKEVVAQDLIIQGKERSSSFAIGINFRGERTLFVDHVTREHNFSFANVSAKWMYLTSIGDYFERAYESSVDFCVKNNVSLAFSPGTKQLGKGPFYNQSILQKTKLLFVNKEEAKRILNAKTDDVNELLVALKKLGPAVVSITDGDNGSYAIDEQGDRYELGLASGEAVERTGAGDAYASGFLSAYIKGQKVPDAMRWGSVNAASVIGMVGAQPGLLTEEGIATHLQVMHEFVPKKGDSLSLGSENWTMYTS